LSSNRFFLALVHYPIVNKHGEIITTSITNLDIHDIARCAATYDLEQYYLVHPLAAQHQMAQELLDYWTRGYGAQYNPDRAQALNKIMLTESLAALEQHIALNYDGPICRVVTDARTYPNSISYRALRQQMLEPAASDSQPTNYLLLFGTGYGLAQEVMDKADFILEPIIGRGDYNHLSVRSAASIIIDRLLGPAWFE
jgi:hypothetical protein